MNLRMLCLICAVHRGPVIRRSPKIPKQRWSSSEQQLTFCTLHGVCAYIGDNQEGLEGALWIVLTPKFPTCATPFDSIGDHLSCSTARGDSVHCLVTIDEGFLKMFVLLLPLAIVSKKEGHKPFRQQAGQTPLMPAAKNSFNDVFWQVALKPLKVDLTEIVKSYGKYGETSERHLRR